jgi:chitinase
VESGIAAYLAAGAEPAQLVLGMPYYGRGWSGVGATDAGLHQPASSVPMGTWEAGAFDWSDIDQNYLPYMDRHWSADAMVPWLYDGRAQIFITYDDAESLDAKAAFIREQGLGGGMVWDLSSDDDAATLTRGLHTSLFGE